MFKRSTPPKITSNPMAATKGHRVSGSTLHLAARTRLPRESGDGRKLRTSTTATALAEDRWVTVAVARCARRVRRVSALRQSAGCAVAFPITARVR